MDFLDITLLSIALGIDCFIVSVSQGLIFTKQRRLNSLKLAVFMGGFQGVMPVIGYIAANKVYSMLVPYSKRIVFAIFLILGLHFILESFSKEGAECPECISLKCLTGLAVATSLDALVSGVTIKLTSANLLFSALAIGITSFIMSQAGFWLGNIAKKLPKRYLQIAGGLILILLAVKSLIF